MTTKREYLDLLLKSADDGTFPSTSGSFDACLYRGPNGKKCAIGILIPDDKYDPEFENASTSSVIAAAGIVVDGLKNMDFYDIQRTHDNLAYRKIWNAEGFKTAIKALPCFQKAS